MMKARFILLQKDSFANPAPLYFAFFSLSNHFERNALPNNRVLDPTRNIFINFKYTL